MQVLSAFFNMKEILKIKETFPKLQLKKLKILKKSLIAIVSLSQN